MNRFPNRSRTPARSPSGTTSDTRRLIIRASVAPWTGYHDHLKLMVDALLKMGVNILIRPITVCEHLAGDHHPICPMLKSRFVSGIQPEEWELLLSTPNEAPTPGKRTVYFTMWESTKLRPEAVHNLNQAEIVVVPCNWNRECFIACGVRAPIRVCHLGMDASIYRHHPMPSSVGPLPFVFGVAGRITHGDTRKGVNEAIRLFSEAFPNGDEPVCLKVKCFKDDPLHELPQDARIEVEKRYLTDQQIAKWLASLHCFVALAKGEGWGAIQHQAMMVGRPVLGPIYSGTEMFMTERNCIPLSHTLTAPPPGNFYEGLGYWASPMDDRVIHAMRWAADPGNRSELQDKSCLSSLDAGRLTHMESNRRLLEVLMECGAL